MVVFLIGIIFLACLGASFKEKPAWIDPVMNILLAIWGSDVIVFVIEALNYQDSKKSLMYDFIFESGRIINKFKNLRYCLREKRGDYVELRKVYIEICDINIFPFYVLHNSFDFFHSKSNYYILIERISDQITKFLEEVESKKDYLLFNNNDQFVNQAIDYLNKKFEKEVQLGVGSVRLTDIVESIEAEVFKLQEEFFKVKIVPAVVK